MTITELKNISYSEDFVLDNSHYKMNQRKSLAMEVMTVNLKINIKAIDCKPKA